jgi:serine/threonine protein kinase
LIHGVDQRKGGEVSLFYPKLRPGFTPAGVLKSLGSTLTQNQPLRDTPYCAIRDADLDQEKRVFTVIDRPEGQPLYTLLREQKSLDLNLALSLMIQLCELLKRSHDHQIFAATLTLHNLIVQPRPNGLNRLYLIDLGLDRRPLSDAVHSPPRELISPPHSSLTQERDRRHFIVYLCSALLHHLVFGVAPDAPVSTLDRAWPSLPYKGKQLDPKLEACLHTILLKGLAVDPQRRFLRMSAL